MEVFQPNLATNYILPYFEVGISAGFPSPADDYMEHNLLDLNKLLIDSPNSTFFIRVVGESMIGAGIDEGSLLIVDKSLKATNNKIVIAVVNNEFTVKRLKITDTGTFLIAENPSYLPIKMKNEDYIWGVVTSVINSF